MKKIAILISSAMLIFMFASCGSTPAPEEPAPAAPTVEVAQPEPQPEPEPEPVVELPKVDNTLALKGIDDARNLALESGIEEYAPDRLQEIDDLYESIKAKSESGEDVSAECADLANRYAALVAYVDACKANDIIDDTNMMYLAEALYNQGFEDLVAYEELFEDPNSTGKQQLDKATSASVALNSALVIIYKQVTKDERTDAFVAKKNADSVKAAVAQKSKYDEGVEYFKKGDSLYAMQSYEKAYDNYEASKEIFLGLYEDIASKRAAAQKLIDEAKAKVKESEEFALQADKKAPIKTKIDGIEDEDAVLLEEDEYDDPSDAEVDLPETIEDPLVRMIIGDNAK